MEVQWTDREEPDRPGPRTAAPHNSAGTFHITAILNGIMQCMAWVAVRGSPTGSTLEVFLLEDGVVERTLNQELGDLGSSSSFIPDLPRALGKYSFSLSHIFHTCKMGTIISDSPDLSHQV